jgi:hypothetical protein
MQSKVRVMFTMVDIGPETISLLYAHLTENHDCLWLLGRFVFQSWPHGGRTKLQATPDAQPDHLDASSSALPNNLEASVSTLLWDSKSS